MLKKAPLAKAPYDEWTYYEYTRGEDGRKSVVLTHPDGRRHCLLYSRYLVEVNIGRRLTSNEHVDHINDNRFDDRLENLQILGASDNCRKSAKPRRWVKLRCAVCQAIFDRTYNTVQCKLPHHVVCCSRACAGNKRKPKGSGEPYIIEHYVK